MYQTLYRKYRPNNLDEVVGQEIIVKTLKNAILKNKLNHAYLFTGPRGTGKTSVAKILAKTVNCENLSDYIPCNNCVSCTQIKNKQTIDIIEIDAASNNGVDEIREIRNNVNLVPSTGKYKIYIIDEVHMLTTGAFNALLKTLEEPPAHIIFILATTEPHKIPSTILSRCQRFDFKKINYKNMIERLSFIVEQEKISVEDNVLLEISRLSDGCMRDALSILDQVIAYSDDKITVEDVHEINGTIAQKQLKEFVWALLDNNYNEIFNLIDNYDNNGKNFIKLTEEIILFLKNILLNINVKNYFKDEEKNIYDDISKKFDNEKIVKFIKTFNEAIYNMKKANNIRIVFEMTIIEIINANQENLKNTEPDNVNNSKIENKIIEDKKEIPTKTINIIERKTIEPPKKIDKNIEKIKDIRINNCLCKFNKNDLLDLKSKIEEIRLLIIDPDYSEIASMVIDGDIRAVGGENIIFVYNNIRDVNNFNQKIFEIDKMLTEHFNTVYKTISVDKENWEVIKKEFNSKTKKYEYIEEPKLEQQNNNETEIEEIFNDIIEYN